MQRETTVTESKETDRERETDAEGERERESCRESARLTTVTRLPLSHSRTRWVKVGLAT